MSSYAGQITSVRTLISSFKACEPESQLGAQNGTDSNGGNSGDYGGMGSQASLITSFGNLPADLPYYSRAISSISEFDITCWNTALFYKSLR